MRLIRNLRFVSLMIAGFLWFCSDKGGGGIEPYRFFFPFNGDSEWEYLRRSRFSTSDTGYTNSTIVVWQVQDEIQVIDGEACFVIRAVEEGPDPDTAYAAYHHEPGEGLYLWAVEPDFMGQPLLKSMSTITRLEKVLLISEKVLEDTVWTTGEESDRILEKKLRISMEGEDTLLIVQTRFQDELISTDYFSSRGLERRAYPVEKLYDETAEDTVFIEDTLVLMETGNN